MANFNAMFAGCESFMEGDVEINNDVTMPDTGEALEAETVAEDVGAEGGEIAGEAETADTKAEAANMVFDQVLNMYRHVKRNGIDRTFLSLYNNQGQLLRHSLLLWNLTVSFLRFGNGSKNSGLRLLTSSVKL